MQTSRFQLGLIATLAVGLGFSLSSSEAIGYPAGAAVSMGANPVWSVGGAVGDGSHVVITAPADQDLVVSDVFFGPECINCTLRFSLAVPDGTLASYRYRNQYYFYGPGERGFSYRMDEPVEQSLRSGLRVPAGDSLTLTVDGTVDYTLSGYYAQP
jgi:hypothetical protein